jgi:hypothetical protein
VYVIGGEGGKEGGPLLRIPPEVGGKVACGRFDSGSLRSIGFDPVLCVPRISSIAVSSRVAVSATQP